MSTTTDSKIIFEPYSLIAKNFNNNGAIVNEDFSIFKATVKDFEDLQTFLLEDFLLREPLNAALDVSREEAYDFFAEIINTAIEDKISYLVRRKDSIDNGKVVAVRLTCILKRPTQQKNEVLLPKQNRVFKSLSKLPKILQIKAFLNCLESQTWNLLPNEVNKLASWMILSVDSNFKRRGIGRKLINYSLEEIRNLGCQGIVTEATAFNSQELFSKEEYERLYEIYHIDWLDENEKQIFKCHDNTCKATLEYKALL